MQNIKAPAGKNHRRQENEAFAIARYIKGGERKLSLVAGLIRGLPVQKALVQLEFNRRRVSNEVKKVLESAIANAENNHGLDVDRLFVKTAIVGRTITMKRFHARGRGKSAPVEKPFSNITIIVQERAAGDEVKKGKKAAKKDAAKAKSEKAEKPAKAAKQKAGE
jgi:large subunit ribosomal protein L22